MAELIQQFKERIDREGLNYLVRVYGQPRGRGSWEGWLEFHPVEDTPSVLRTGVETSQPDRASLAHWASALESVYFTNALGRARIVADIAQ